MRDRVESIARFLETWNWRLTPAFLHRLDHRLVTHRPLLWRVRLHWVAWWSAVASFGAFLVAYFSSRSSADVWNPGELVKTCLTIGYVSLIVGLLWGVLQLRRPIGERPLLDHLRLFLLNTLTIALLFLPNRVFALTATFRAAHCMPDATFQQEFEWHRRHNFWRCSEHITPELVSSSHAKLTDALARFNLKAPGVAASHAVYCANGGSSLELVSAADASPSSHDSGMHLALEEKLKSIQHSKELWRRLSGMYYEELVAVRRRGFVLACLIALVLGIASHPASSWRRIMIRRGIGRSQATTKQRRLELARRARSHRPSRLSYRVGSPLASCPARHSRAHVARFLAVFIGRSFWGRAFDSGLPHRERFRRGVRVAVRLACLPATRCCVSSHGFMARVGG